jgi:hypothetical protein
VSKLIILSIVLTSFALPALFSTSARPRRALRRVQWMMFAFIVFWSYMCLHWYPDLVPLK